MKQSYRNSHKSEEVSQSYDYKFSYRVDSLIWREFVKPYVREKLEQAKNNGASTYLDFATGTGRLLKVGHNIFDSATAIDISENMLKEARRRVPDAKLFCLDVTHDDTANIGLFDYVTMFRFLRNAEPALRKEVLEWLNRHISDGGLLMINNHGNTHSLMGLITRLAFWLPEEKKNLLSRKETYTLLEKAGFSVVSCTGFNILPSLFGRPMFGHWLHPKIERLCKKLGLGLFGGELIIIAIKN